MKTNFENKEQYLNFRAAWSAAVNSPNAKSTVVPCGEYAPNDRGGYSYSSDTGRCRKFGWIRHTHTIIFNILRGRDVEYGYTPLTNPKKIKHAFDGYVNRNLVDNVKQLHFMIDDAKELEQYKNNPGLIKENAKKRHAISHQQSWRKVFTSIDKYVEQEEYNLERLKKRVEDFLEPFDGTVTVKMLAELYVPKVALKKGEV